MFESMSIQKRMNYLIAMATFAIFTATVFVFWSMDHIESEYQYLRSNSMKAGLTTLKIEKSLNYISRTTRDIMLGGDYKKDITKLQNTIKDIQGHFNTLEDLMRNDYSLSDVQNAKSSTMLFLNSSLDMMLGLTKNEIANETAAVYQKYKHELTPYANTSRTAFKKLLAMKEKELKENSESLRGEIQFYKYLVLIAGTLTGLVILIIATLIRK